MTAQSAHDWALHRWRTLLDQAWAATPGPWRYMEGDDARGIAPSLDHDLVWTHYDGDSGMPPSAADATLIAALGPDRVIVLCEQAIDRLTAHAPNPGSWCDGCRDDDGYGYNPVDWPCPEVRAWTAWWASEDDYPEELRR